MDAINLLCRGLVDVETYETLAELENVIRLERNELARERRQKRVDEQRAMWVNHVEHWAAVYDRFGDEWADQEMCHALCMAELVGVQIRN
jgi:hypothetical protein